MKSTISEMKNIQEGIKSRLDEAEDRISNLEDKVAENNQSSRKKKFFSIRLGLGQVVQLFRAWFQCAKVVGSIPSEGIRKNQPMNP